jgi:hypothetical protein
MFSGNKMEFSVTAWSVVLIEKLFVFQLVKKFPSSVEPIGALPCSQETTTGSFAGQVDPFHTLTPCTSMIHLNFTLHYN